MPRGLFRCLLTALLIANSSARVGEGVQKAAAAPLTNTATDTPHHHHDDVSPTAMYPLKQRNTRQVTEHWSMMDLKQKYMLTFDENSPPKTLEPFLLQLTETDGLLPKDPSLETVATALETFLTAELNVIFAPTHAVEEIQAIMVEQRAIAANTGSELLTSVEVTFKYEPSPEQAMLELWVQSIMANLTMFVSNITAIADGDPELVKITSARRSVYVPFEWSSVGKDDTDDGTSGIVDGNTDKSPSSSTTTTTMPYIIVPTVLAGALIVGLLVLLSMQRSKRRRLQLLCFTAQDPNERPSRLLAQANLQKNKRGGGGSSKNNNSEQISVFMDEDNDIFSFEAGLLDSPAGKQQRVSPTNNKRSSNNSYESDIFSGVDSLVTSPKNNHAGAASTGGASILSFFSAFTNRSEATVPVSNTTAATVANNSKGGSSGYVLGISTRPSTNNNSTGTDPSGTPHSNMGSLFAFSEEEGADTDDSDDDDDDDNTLPMPLPSPKLPYDEALDREIMEDFMIDTASMNSETQMQDQYDAAILNSPHPHVPHVVVSEELKLYGLGATTSDGIDSPVSSAGDGDSQPPLADPTTEARILPEETLTEPAVDNGPSSPKKKWFNFLKSNKKASRQEDRVESPLGIEPREDVAADVSSPMSAEVNLEWNDAGNAQRNAAAAAAFVDAVKTSTAESPQTEEQLGRGRRHAKSSNTDGTEQYQRETMDPNPEWSIDDLTSSTPSAGSPQRHAGEIRNSQGMCQPNSTARQSRTPIPTSTSKAKNDSNISGLSSVHHPQTSANTSSSINNSSSMNISSSINTSGSLPFDVKGSPSHQLIKDLAWLEKKMKAQADKAMQTLSPRCSDGAEPQTDVQVSDSLSFTSESDLQLLSSSGTSSRLSGSLSPRSQAQHDESIICRDCIAPPGKLKIIIHSTKDGPAVHTVKEGSALEGQIFAGDLIISVDNVDTRSYTAEQVMKMMTAKSKFERTITVLHFAAVQTE